MADFEETEYAKQVVEWLQNRDWEVFKEVEAPDDQRVADIYAVKGDPDRPRKTWAVEVKTSFSLRVIEQANFWTRHAHYASVAIPSAVSERTYNFGRQACKNFGIGVLRVIEGDYGPMYAEEVQHADKSAVTDFPGLYEKQKEYEAGNADNEHYSKFDQFADRLVNFVKDNEGVTLRYAINQLPHHYKTVSSAYTTLKRAISNRAIPEIEIVWRQSEPHLLLTE